MTSLTRRSFVALSATLVPSLAWAKKKIPIGLELYSVRDELGKDLMGTVRAVGKMGYEVVEFYSPYFRWTPDYAKEVRKLLDDLGVRCLSTHNDNTAFNAENLQKAIDLNQAIGSRTVVMASPGRINGLDDWKKVAEKLTAGHEKFKAVGMRAGYHNHKSEFVPVDGKRPLEILADNTPKDMMLQLDVGTCMEAGSDPVAWVNAHPGRIRSMHVKDWAPGEEKDNKGYRVLFGEGTTPWKNLLKAAEKKGGVEYFLIEQEGSRYTSLETAQRCLDLFKKMRG